MQQFQSDEMGSTTKALRTSTTTWILSQHEYNMVLLPLLWYLLDLTTSSLHETSFLY